MHSDTTIILVQPSNVTTESSGGKGKPTLFIKIFA